MLIDIDDNSFEAYFSPMLSENVIFIFTKNIFIKRYLSLQKCKKYISKENVNRTCGWSFVAMNKDLVTKDNLQRISKQVPWKQTAEEVRYLLKCFGQHTLLPDNETIRILALR